MTRSCPAGYRRPAPRPPWRGQVLLAVFGLAMVAVLLGWTAGVR